MNLDKGKITILINAEKTTIELICDQSSTVFATIELSPEQLSKALSRIAHVECDIKVRNLDRINKILETKYHEFEIPDNLPYEGRTTILNDLAKKTLPEGWINDNYFSSQNTFFKKDGKNYARCTIRRWV